MAGIYAQVMAYVSTQTGTFISTKTPLVAEVLKPAAAAFMSIYIILHGLAHLNGRVQEPLKEFMMKVAKMVAIYAIGINMLNYNEYIVDTFVNSPDAIAAAIGGGSVDASTITTLDSILDSAFKTGKGFWDNAGILNGNIGAYIAAFVCWAMGIIVTVYACFLIVLSKIFLAVIVAVGPLFIISLWFEPTQKFFEAWIAQLANYGLVVVLVTATNVFTIGMFESAATQAAALGGNVSIADVFPLVVTALISLLVLAQVPQAAAGLAGGIAIGSYGVGRMIFGQSKALAGQTVGRAGKAAGTKAGAWAGKKIANAYRERRNRIQGSRSRSGGASGSSGSASAPGGGASAAGQRMRQMRAEARKGSARGGAGTQGTSKAA